jgi:hypothetical protein
VLVRKVHSDRGPALRNVRELREKYLYSFCGQFQDSKAQLEIVIDPANIMHGGSSEDQSAYNECRKRGLRSSFASEPSKAKS